MILYQSIGTNRCNIIRDIYKQSARNFQKNIDFYILDKSILNLFTLILVILNMDKKILNIRYQILVSYNGYLIIINNH